MTITDLNEMMVIAVEAKQSGFKQISVDPAHIIEMTVMVSDMYEMLESALGYFKGDDVLDIKGIEQLLAKARGEHAKGPEKTDV